MIIKVKTYFNKYWTRLRQYLESTTFVKQIIILITTITAVLVVIMAWFFSPNPLINKAAVELAQTAEHIRLFYQTKPGYWGLNGELAIKNNLQASGMMKDGMLYNAFGKPVIIGQDAAGSIVMPGTRYFMIPFPGLNKSECTAMAAFRLNERESLSLLQMEIMTDGKTFEFNWGGKPSLPITKTDAAKYCGKTNTVSWRFE